jgi:hypothetical protein
VVGFALVVLSGCGDTRTPAGKAPRSSAVARCTGAECRVRIRCKGKLHIRRGPAPVSIRTSKTALVTTIIADFAGSKNDALIRC